MLAYVAIPLACWLCALVAIPRKPRTGNEVEELIYLRLLGRQQRLVLLACVVSALTVGTVVLNLPHNNDPKLAMLGGESVACVEHGTYAVCNTGTTGTRVIRERQVDGTWVTVGAVTMPGTYSTTNNDVALQETNPVALTTEHINKAERSSMAAHANAVEANVNRVCHFRYSDIYQCAVFQTDGTWLREEVTDDGSWVVTAQAVPVSAVRLP